MSSFLPFTMLDFYNYRTIDFMADYSHVGLCCCFLCTTDSFDFLMSGKKQSVIHGFSDKFLLLEFWKITRKHSVI